MVELDVPRMMLKVGKKLVHATEVHPGIIASNTSQVNRGEGQPPPRACQAESLSVPGHSTNRLFPVTIGVLSYKRSEGPWL